MTRRLVFPAVVVLACCTALIKPAVIRIDHVTRLAVLLRWQSGHIDFINSVTGRPVTIAFRIGQRFQTFSFVTDSATEEYYTNGGYDLNAAVAAEATDRLSFCSQKGITLEMGFYAFDVRDGCLEVDLLWTLF